jgi:glycerophosphoryl diester phosphodiesterase
MSHHQPWPYPRALAHRGGGSLAPENTIAAIRVGVERGFRAVEFDAMLAADGVPMLMHDETLERTTDGRGPVSALTAAELGRLDAGAWYAPGFAREPVPTFEAAVGFCRAQDVWINIEIKPAAGHEERTGEVVALQAAELYADLVRRGGDRADNAEPRIPLLSSFSEVALAAARRAAPDLPRGLLVDRVPADWPDRLLALGCVGLHTNHQHLAEPIARSIKDAGYWLFCYTVNVPERARQIRAWGVDAFCTDRIDLIRPDA